MTRQLQVVVRGSQAGAPLEPLSYLTTSRLYSADSPLIGTRLPVKLSKQVEIYSCKQKHHRLYKSAAHTRLSLALQHRALV